MIDWIHHKIAKIEFLTFHKYHNAEVRYSWNCVQTSFTELFAFPWSVHVGGSSE